MREVISLHVGQCGNRLGSACWEQFNREKELFTGPGSKYCEVPDSFYRQIKPEIQWLPRACFFDSSDDELAGIFESSALANVFKNLCHTASINQETTDCLTEKISDSIRRQAEECNSLLAFFVYLGMAGHTSRVLSQVITNLLHQDYPKTDLEMVGVLSSSPAALDFAASYNTVCALGSEVTTRFVYDNRAIALNYLESRCCLRPTLLDLNLQIVESLSFLTEKLRLNVGFPKSDRAKIYQDLVPFKTVCNISCAVGPMVPAWSPPSPFDTSSASAMFPLNLMAGLPSDRTYGQHLGWLVMFRGASLQSRDIHQILVMSLQRRMQVADRLNSGWTFDLVRENFPRSPAAKFASTSVTSACFTNCLAHFSAFQAILNTVEAKAAQHGHREGYDLEDIEPMQEAMRASLDDVYEIANGFSEEEGRNDDGDDGIGADDGGEGGD